jgi:hypothetical protein
MRLSSVPQPALFLKLASFTLAILPEQPIVEQALFVT